MQSRTPGDKVVEGGSVVVVKGVVGEHGENRATITADIGSQMSSFAMCFLSS